MRVILATIAAVLALGFTVSIAEAQPRKGGVELTGLKAADPQPGKLQPGLAVSYRYGIINHVDEIADTVGEPGEPLPQLNYNVGFKKVLTSRMDDGVQARIVGFIKFDAPGAWKFAVHSNDGVRLWIGDKKIYELPDVHADTMSEIFSVTIDKAGWYPIKVLYFEKRNTATLELYWAPPGKSDMAIVPASAFGHAAK